MNEFRFLVGMIVILELVLFACGLKVVENRHNARKLFIELEHEQQIHHSLMDERAHLKLEISNLEQAWPKQVCLFHAAFVLYRARRPHRLASAWF